MTVDGRNAGGGRLRSEPGHPGAVRQHDVRRALADDLIECLCHAGRVEQHVRQWTSPGEMSQRLHVGLQSPDSHRCDSSAKRFESANLRKLNLVVRQRHDFEIDAWSEGPRDVKCAKAIAAIRRVR